MTAKPRLKRDSLRVPIDLRSLGPKMRALPNDKWRAAAVARFVVKGGNHGKNTAACRVAGFGNAESTALNRTAYKVFHDPRMLEALHELGEQYLKQGVPDAIAVVNEIMNDPRQNGANRLKAAEVYINRAHPVESLHRVTVEHKIDYQRQALEELAAFRRLGVSREKLAEIYGRDGLFFLEQQLDGSPKMIEGTAEDIS